MQWSQRDEECGHTHSSQVYSKEKISQGHSKNFDLTLKLSSLNVVGSLAVALYTLMLYCFQSVLNVELEKGTLCFK